jgi:hypothetical protein
LSALLWRDVGVGQTGVKVANAIIEAVDQRAGAGSLLAGLLELSQRRAKGCRIIGCSSGTTAAIAGVTAASAITSVTAVAGISGTTATGGTLCGCGAGRCLFRCGLTGGFPLGSACSFRLTAQALVFFPFPSQALLLRLTALFFFQTAAFFCQTLFLSADFCFTLIQLGLGSLLLRRQVAIFCSRLAGLTRLPRRRRLAGLAIGTGCPGRRRG